MSSITKFADGDLKPVVTTILAAKADEIRAALSASPTQDGSAAQGFWRTRNDQLERIFWPRPRALDVGDFNRGNIIRRIAVVVAAADAPGQ